MLKRIILFIFAISLLINCIVQFTRPALGKQETTQERPLIVRLGERLFRDDRFSTPNGDLPASCSNCHLFDEDPQGIRAFADFFNRSWVSFRTEDPERLELRNSPTLFDVAQMPRLHHDGEFGSLEDLVKGTLSGRPMGWLPGEQEQAFERIRSVVFDDKGEGKWADSSYRDQYKKAFGVDLEKLSRDQIVSLTARAVADFMRTLKSRRDSSYDEFIRVNRLELEPKQGEQAVAFAQRMLANVNELEAKGALKLPAGFKADALQGLKIFFRTEGDASIGSCITCHAPPLFTDFSFHNIGVSQREYDRIHGDGKFALLQIPNSANAIRPSAQFRRTPAKGKPGAVDLGYWNFVDLKTSPLRRAGESDDQFLRRMIGAFKTPTLRNLGFSSPYLHTGSLNSLADVVVEIMQSSEMARAGRLREADEGLAKIRVTESDIAPLIAFLNTLNDNLKRGN